MANTRLTVVVRTDLQMSAGLLAAQVSHMADSWIRKMVTSGKWEARKSWPKKVITEIDEDQAGWLPDPYISVLAIGSREELDDLINSAYEHALPVREWEDLLPAPTLGKPMRFKVGVALGPADFDKIKLVTGDLPLYP